MVGRGLRGQVLAGGAVGIFFAGSFVLVVYMDDD
jgi:hypothetical protein